MQRNTEIGQLGATLLEVAAVLMVSGASTGRIRNTVTRLSNSFGFNTDMLISQRTLMLTIYDEENDFLFSSLKRTSPHGVNFKLLSGISRMSWQVAEEKWTVKQINDELKRLKDLKHYPRVVVLSLVALAGSAFCRLAGGAFSDMMMVFLGTFAGLFVRQEATRLRFNPYMCVYFGAFVSSLIAGSLQKFAPGEPHDHAFATSVLFLIPGVPLINSFSDMIDGNLQNGLIRGLNGFIISFSIALGLLTSKFIYQL